MGELISDVLRVRKLSSIGRLLVLVTATAVLGTPAPYPPGAVASTASAQNAVAPERAGTVPSSAANLAEQRFWVNDTNFYRSSWYAGAHRKMINFGCTRAPYYPPSPRCTNDRGFHHGIDMAMPCGNRLFAGLRGMIVDPDSAGSLGSAYGQWAFRIRNQRFDIDVVIGHVRRVFVQPGDRVVRGQPIARASDAGAPDGCHLHFEVRPKGRSYDAAIRPAPYLALRRVG